MAWENFSFADNNADGLGDAGSADLNGDGHSDTQVFDTDYDGRLDLQTTDVDRNGITETIIANNDGDDDFETTMKLNNQTGGLESVTTPETGQVQIPAGPPAADPGIIGGSSGGGISSSPVSMANRGDAGTIGGSDDHTSTFIGGSPTGVIGGSSSGGPVDSLLNSPVLMNDPAGVNLAGNLIQSGFVNGVRWTLPDGFEIVEWDF